MASILFVPSHFPRLLLQQNCLWSFSRPRWWSVKAETRVARNYLHLSFAMIFQSVKWRSFLRVLFCLSGIVSLTDCMGVSPQCVGSRRWLERCSVARIHLLASGHGRPACCTGACISVELSSLILIGWFPQPTAF